MTTGKKFTVEREEKNTTQTVKLPYSPGRSEAGQSPLQDYFSSIYHSIIDLLIVFDEDYTIVEVNGVVSEKLGFQIDELIGASVHDYVKSSFRPLFTQFSSEVLLHKRAENFELELITKCGGSLWVSCSASKMSISESSKQQVLLLAKDISQLKQTQKDLEAKNKELDTFVYRTSHDLMGPIASILGVTELSKKDLIDPVATNYMNMVDGCATRIKGILIELNELARMRSTPMKVTKVDLEKVCVDLIEAKKSELRIQEIDFIRSFHHTKRLQSNERLVQSILAVIIDNALTYRKVNYQTVPQVSIETEDFKNGVNVTIRDNGMGIASHLLGRVMDMFERATEASKGAGLGLYIAKTSVERIGGVISIDSEQKKYTEVRVWFPSLQGEVI